MGKKLFLWSMKRLVNCIEQMTSKEKKFDCIIFISGKRGTGKSTLAYKLASLISSETPFRPKRDIVYSREETLKHYANKINGIVFADEMINVAYKREFHMTEQIELLKAFDMYRDSRNIFIGCVPIFTDLDVKIQKVCKIWLDVRERGKALIHTQNDSSYSNDPWDLKNNFKIESDWTIKGVSKPRYANLSTCRGLLIYGDLTPLQREEYEAIKAEKRSHVFSKYSDDSLVYDPDKLFLINIVKNLKEGKVTPEIYSIMCNTVGKDPEQIRRKINIHLKEQGDTKTWKDYCLSHEIRVKKDRLGFKLPYTSKPKPIIPINGSEAIKNDSDIDNTVHDDIIKPQEGDILGFKE